MANDTGQAFEACAKIRRDERVEDLIQATTRSALFLNILPVDAQGGGWLYMSSQDSFAIWNVQTVQDRVLVNTNRKTGPASWARVWISGGAAASVFVPQMSGAGISQVSGLVTGNPAAPRVRCWFQPYSENEAFETFSFSFGANAWDDFGALGAGANENVGYPPRLCRALYLASNQALTVNLGIDFVPYARVAVTDQGGVWVDSWSAVNLLNTGGVNANIMGSWANTPISLINP